MVARAFLSSSLLLWSMSSISRTFCRGVRESWNQARNSQSPQRREGRAGLQSLGHSRPFLSAHIPYSTLIRFPVASPTWEISARMIPRYCLPCPRDSMSARNSFLSWISFTTGQGEGALVYQALGPSGSWQGWRGQGLPLRERVQFCGQCSSLVGPRGSPPPPVLGLCTHSPPP